VVRIPVESSVGTLAVNIWHYRITNASPITETNEAIDALDTFYTAIQGMLAPQTFNIGFRVITEDQTPNVIIPAQSEVATGTGTAQSLLAASAVLGLTSGIVGGSNRGRKYIGPLDQAATQSDGRSLNATDRTTLLSAAANLLTPTASGSVLGIWSRKNSAFTVATGVTCGTILGVQRRRMH
jgi:hypothetical protein